MLRVVFVGVREIGEVFTTSRYLGVRLMSADWDPLCFGLGGRRGVVCNDEGVI